jgi:hypothetical protein
VVNIKININPEKEIGNKTEGLSQDKVQKLIYNTVFVGCSSLWVISKSIKKNYTFFYGKVAKLAQFMKFHIVVGKHDSYFS